MKRLVGEATQCLTATLREQQLESLRLDVAIGSNLRSLGFID